MWEHVEGSNVVPATLDRTSSGKYVYFRKNIVHHDAQENWGEHYSWDEMKVPREVWEIAQAEMEHELALSDVYEALEELAGMITEGL